MDINTQRSGIKLGDDIIVDGTFAGEIAKKIFNYQGDFKSPDFLKTYQAGLSALKELGDSIVKVQALLPTIADINNNPGAVAMSDIESA